MEKSLKTANSYKKILGIALPMALAVMIPQVSILTNTIFLGHYNSSDGLVQGKDVLAVAGVAGIYYYMFVMVTFGLASGILMLMSRRAGEDDAKGVGHVFSAGFQLGLVLTLILLLISFLFSNQFFEFSLQNVLVQTQAQNFIALRIWGLPFLFMAHLGNMLFIAVDKTSFMLYGAIGETIITIILDYLLIFGNLGFPEMGVEGAAIASGMAEFILFVVVFGIIFYNKQFTAFRLRLFSHIPFATLKKYLILSSPLMLQFFLSIGAWEVFFIFVEHLGEEELGASQIVRSVYGIMGIAVWALASTANSMVSNLYGQKNYDHILPLIGKIVKVCLCYAVVISVLILLFKEPLLAIYTNDKVIHELVHPTLYIVIAAAFVFSISLIYFNGMLGLGDTKRNLAYESITIFVYIVYCYIVVERLQSELWVAWTSEFVYWFVMLAFSGVYMHSKKWIPRQL